jgi:peptide/nickel transport system ATP-binding protein/oligopeptide transport system ATP-binding protein
MIEKKTKASETAGGGKSGGGAAGAGGIAGDKGTAAVDKAFGAATNKAGGKTAKAGDKPAAAYKPFGADTAAAYKPFGSTAAGKVDTPYTGSGTTATAGKPDRVLSVKNLKVIFITGAGIIKAVEGVDLEIGRGECIGLVGESGCGKSVTALSIMKLLSTPPAAMRADELSFDGVDLNALSDVQMQDIRGSRISMVFQDALTALNPVMTVGRQIDEVYLRHNKDKKLTKREAKAASIEVLRAVGVPSPEKRYNDFPHQLSGGMRQRVLIATAFACQPALMIADEPTTALDVTIQAQVLDLLGDLQKRNGMALLLITHDLTIIANMAKRVYVMYCGKIVETAPAKEIFKNPMHPYTRGLIGAVPKLNEKIERFIQIPDNVPHPMFKPDGCYFHPRCEFATDQCKQSQPRLREVEKGRQVRCFNYKRVIEANGGGGDGGKRVR